MLDLDFLDPNTLDHNTENMIKNVSVFFFFKLPGGSIASAINCHPSRTMDLEGTPWHRKELRPGSSAGRDLAAPQTNG